MRGALPLLVALLAVCAASIAVAKKPGDAWQSLFDGVSTQGWHNVGRDSIDADRKSVV